MTTLRALWEVSLALCLLAVLALLVLLVARVLAARFSGRNSAARRRLLPLLLDGDPATLEPLGRAELQVAADLTIELAEMTRGSERDALLARAASLGVVDLLVKRMRSRSPQTRLFAVEALSLFDDAREKVVGALDDRNPDVRLGAALALARYREAPAALTIVNKLNVREEENSLLLVSLMIDLVETNSEAVAGLLFEKDLSNRVKVAAMDALAERGGEYAPLLAYMARDSEGEPDLQPRIYRALGKTGHPIGAEAIFEGLGSASWTVRAAAAEAVGRARLAAAADRLSALLEDPNYWVRYRASEALLRIGPTGIKALREASDSEDPVVRTAAVKMLAEGRAR
ncbi:HEAT repeat domain-containing protein [Aurantiacibacter poecillastricola]|uniref:HEAT repeat domain-containing protein n=1 Tax=Aurantiacibacter poecillastricola TaxID=3064385 RepID=UPI00273DDA54|nr:HEAT repeat domain-containing protein [Aurantiacibacter sp. 219JJ12-13]MDP5262393.1 HEAT repeat domain-containing protein [Aurantiacibacter sp. 219JJ12-13]